MGIDFLLALQNFREATDNFFSPFMIWISDFSISFYPIAFLIIIYLVIDRRGGRRLLFGWGLAFLVNGLLKLIFQVPRPWIKDARVEPYGDSKKTATGFSFPSGHSTRITSSLGSISIWAWIRSRKVISIICAVIVLIVLFSRNYLGVHTPVDVLAGFLSSLIMTGVAYLIEGWTDKDPRRDIPVMIAGLAICAGLMIFYESIHIDPVYDDAGKLIIDPVKMVADSYSGLGAVSAYVVCRYFERRRFNWDNEKSWQDRFVFTIILLVPLYFWFKYAVDMFSPISRNLGKFLRDAGIIAYSMILIPYIMSKVTLPHALPESTFGKENE